MPATSPIYRFLIRAGIGAIPLAGRISEKLARGDRGRRGAVAHLTGWAGAHRDRARPLVWFHAPSVGEGLQARAVIERLRARHGDWQLVYTHFSPSAESFARQLPVDAFGYLPYDTPEAAQRVLDALAPSALVFSKLDLWPELASQAAGRGVQVGLIAGTVSPVSGRTVWPSRELTRPGYQALAAAGAIAAEDAERLIQLGVDPGRVRVIGDPRYDSVLDVVRAVPPDDPLLQLGRAGATLVAGSTWPPDEQVLLEALVRVRDSHPDARLIVVPHEPTRAHLEQVDARAARLGLPRPARLSLGGSPDPLLLVDQVGLLARLYGTGQMAYVGGGFGRAGLHSVLEPAAWGLPIVHGPRWQNSRDAGILREAGGALPLPNNSPPPAERLAAIWTGWLASDTARREAGARARAVVEAGAGAAGRSVELVEGLVTRTV